MHGHAVGPFPSRRVREIVFREVEGEPVSVTLPPIVSFVGRSNSGKTTLLEKLIALLTARGYAVGTVKHHFHGDFAVDYEGKDSWRHRQAGAVAVALSSPLRLAIVSQVESEVDVAEIVRRFPRPVDIVLTEGFKLGPWPKIEVNRAAQGGDLMCTPRDNLVAVVSDRDLPVGVPRFHLDDAKALADFIEDRFRLRRP